MLNKDSILHYISGKKVKMHGEVQWFRTQSKRFIKRSAFVWWNLNTYRQFARKRKVSMVWFTNTKFVKYKHDKLTSKRIFQRKDMNHMVIGDLSIEYYYIMDSNKVFFTFLNSWNCVLGLVLNLCNRRFHMVLK